MTYKEYYLSKESIEAADPITREAYSVASKMYKKHWGREFNLKCLTEDNIPIVYAFNMAQSLKDCIIKFSGKRRNMKLNGYISGIQSSAYSTSCAPLLMMSQMQIFPALRTRLPIWLM